MQLAGVVVSNPTPSANQSPLFDGISVTPYAIASSCHIVGHARRLID